jgi:hypothetical protein
MAVYAYLRVSTDQQDVDNQRYGVLVYANIRGLGPLQFVADTASGRLAWRERAVGRLLTGTTQPLVPALMLARPPASPGG